MCVCILIDATTAVYNYTIIESYTSIAIGRKYTGTRWSTIYTTNDTPVYIYVHTVSADWNKIIIVFILYNYVLKNKPIVYQRAAAKPLDLKNLHFAQRFLIQHR